MTRKLLDVFPSKPFYVALLFTHMAQISKKPITEILARKAFKTPKVLSLEIQNI